MGGLFTAWVNALIIGATLHERAQQYEYYRDFDPVIVQIGTFSILQSFESPRLLGRSRLQTESSAT